jgi:hypothetical protein
MKIDQIRAQVVANIWQSIAQSGVDISTVPKDQQEKLVSSIADSLMFTVNNLLDEPPPLKKQQSTWTNTVSRYCGRVVRFSLWWSIMC